MLSILIVDDSALVRRCLRSAIEQNPKLRVCGEAENGKVAVDKVKELKPDTVILDLQMPVMNGLEAARQISQCAPNTVILMLTMHDSDRLLKDAQAAGIHDVFSKTDKGPAHLLAWLNEAGVRRAK
jgi:DNA-binding NarL/FixJ family response regulator